MNYFPTEPRVTRESRGGKAREHRCGWDGTREAVFRDIEDPKGGLVERRDGAVKPVRVKAKAVKPVEGGELGGDWASE